MIAQNHVVDTLVIKMAANFASSLRLPSKLDVHSANVSENFKRWKREVQVYISASGGDDKEKKIQTAILLNCAGPHILEIYDQMTWDNEGDKNDPAKVLQAFEKYCNPRDNEVLETQILEPAVSGTF